MLPQSDVQSTLENQAVQNLLMATATGGAADKKAEQDSSVPSPQLTVKLIAVAEATANDLTRWWASSHGQDPTILLQNMIEVQQKLTKELEGCIQSASATLALPNELKASLSPILKDILDRSRKATAEDVMEVDDDVEPDGSSSMNTGTEKSIEHISETSDTTSESNQNQRNRDQLTTDNIQQNDELLDGQMDLDEVLNDNGIGNIEDDAPHQEVQEEPEELTMTEEEFEAEKRRLLRKAVIAETQYKELRARLYENKKKEAAHYREMVVQQKCPIFLRGKADADKELKKKLDINETRYELKMAQIQDEFEAEMLINETQHDDQYAYAKGRFITFYEELIAEKDKRREHIELTMGALLTVPPQSPKANNDSKNEESDGGEGTSAGESSSIA